MARKPESELQEEKSHTEKKENLISQDTDLQDAKFTWVLDEATKLTHPGHEIVNFPNN